MGVVHWVRNFWISDNWPCCPIFNWLGVHWNSSITATISLCTINDCSFDDYCRVWVFDGSFSAWSAGNSRVRFWASQSSFGFRSQDDSSNESCKGQQSKDAQKHRGTGWFLFGICYWRGRGRNWFCTIIITLPKSWLASLDFGFFTLFISDIILVFWLQSPFRVCHCWLLDLGWLHDRRHGDRVHSFFNYSTGDNWLHVPHDHLRLRGWNLPPLNIDLPWKDSWPNSWWGNYLLGWILSHPLTLWRKIDMLWEDITSSILNNDWTCIVIPQIWLLVGKVGAHGGLIIISQL